MRLMDIAVDYDPLPFTQGKILGADPVAGTFDFALEDGFPTLAGPYFAQAAEGSYNGRWGMIFHPAERMLKPGAPDFVNIDGWLPLSDAPSDVGRTWRMQVTRGKNTKLKSMATA